MKLISGIGLLCIISSVSYAELKHEPPAHTIVPPLGVSYWFLNGQVGGQEMSFSSSAKVQNNVSFTAPFNQDTYTTRSKNNSSTVLGVQAGARWKRDAKWFTGVSLGAQYQHFFVANIKGQVMQFSLPQFTNYNYSLQTATNLIVANAKLHFVEYKKFSPFINGGIGGAIHSTSNYSETALAGVNARISPNFSHKTSSDFAYILGAGLEYRLSEIFLMSAAYQYSFLGGLVSGNGASTWSSQHLSFGNSYSNAFIFGFTYLFGTKQ